MFDIISAVIHVLSEGVFHCVVDWSRNKMCHGRISSSPASRKRDRGWIEENGRYIHVISEEGGKLWQNLPSFSQLLSKCSRTIKPPPKSKIWFKAKAMSKVCAHVTEKIRRLLINYMRIRCIKGTVGRIDCIRQLAITHVTLNHLAPRQANSTIDWNG